MTNLLKSRLDALERYMRRKLDGDISTPAGRRAAFWHFQLMDHAFLRILWTNLHEIAPGIWRSNQPDRRRLHRYHAMGIRTVVSLRAATPSSHMLFEQETCAELGMTFLTATIRARRLLPPERYLALLDIFETAERPLLFHCKSGADRAGLAAALYLMHIEGKSVEEAAKMLSPRYLHSRNTRTGILDHMLAAYAADTADRPMPIREWLETRYDAAAITEDFKRWQAAGGRR
ncbi:phosphatase domain-containing protein [Rhodovulum adriaticum]|uniref:Protein tyrosine/serine phosphatase n=1 Tax=Rhodovulum adriaticum TaxID=35804 RepID=A0A4R2NIZ3_RHOAD|nr:tyrosine-protein phosphatase [Rhodovulum adriaticum]MBK1634643.1 hypothetical protein [Rhodovulum adriaticum]TCP21272.1 protein tyrosine/serine phosphatase [Rhodovulum adriaticum]